MVSARRGSIINTASFVAVMGSATSQISYTAAKGGVLALLSVDIRCDVLPPYLRYRRVFANLSEVPPVALFR